ncbi:Protein-tyrosine phosphatase [Trichuris suis]|nr:Protein-tyrosine phosphatase [Trichuris suis]
MEEFPRLPMLYVDLKFSACSVDFGPKLSEYITRNYKEDALNYRPQLEMLNNLREAAVKPSADLTSLSAAKRYYAQLQLLKNRFPLHENGAAAVTFTWLEKYADIPLPVSAEDVEFELACVLHNIGAVHSQLGANDSRLSLEVSCINAVVVETYTCMVLQGMKEACTHFQCSSWAFEQLASEFKTQSRYSQDLDSGLFVWQKLLMLAQAQECILEKSLVDSRKCVVIGKVAVEVVSYYKQCASQLEERGIVDIVGISQFKMWKRFVQMKVYYYSALMNLHIGMQSENEKKWGERLAYYLSAQADINNASKLLKKATDAFSSAIQFVSEIIESRVSVAQKENDFVYHEKVPDYDQLVPWKGVALVKPIAFDISDPDVSGPEIFQKLIPIRVHKLSSIYSEEKAKVLRTLTSKVEEYNESISKILNALKLRETLNKKAFSLPEELIECCAAFQADQDNVYNLMSLLDGFRELAKKLGGDITEMISRSVSVLLGFRNLKTIKKEEMEALKEQQKAVETECKNCLTALDDARNADDRIESVLFSLLGNLELLKLPMDKLAAKMQENSVEIRQSSEAQELIRLLDKADEMVSQRTTLMESLKSSMIDDDISKALLALLDDDYEDLFHVELRKHDKMISLLEQNFSAQENIVRAITEANARFVPLRLKAENFEKRRKENILVLIASYRSFVDLQNKGQDGVHFYDAIKDVVVHLKEKLETLENTFNERSKKEFSGDVDQTRGCRAPASKQQYQAVGQADRTFNAPADIRGLFPTGKHFIYVIPESTMSNFRPLVSGHFPAAISNVDQSIPLRVIRPVSTIQRAPACRSMFFYNVPVRSDLPYKSWYVPTAYREQFYGCPSQPYVGPLQYGPNSVHRPRQENFSSNNVTTSIANSFAVTARGEVKPVKPNLAPIESIMNGIEGAVPADLPPPILPISSTVAVAKNDSSSEAGEPEHLMTTAACKVDQTVSKKTVASVDKKAKPEGSSEQTALTSLQQIAADLVECSEYSEAIVDNREKLRQVAARFEKLVESFDRRSLNGPTLLELTWKEILEHCEAEMRKHTISIAKCYSFKNRVPELLPYDDSRVVLQTAKDDYINASFVKNICENGPNFVITQAPTPQSIEDFWLMIFEQNVELICSVMSASEVKGKRIWPEKNEPIKTPSLRVVVVSKKFRPSYSERLISILNDKTSQVRSLVHLQYSAWIHGSALSSLSGFVDFLIGARSHYIVQRLRSHAICVQSLYGSSRSGVFCLAFSAIHEIMTSGLVPQINLMVEKLWASRKRCIADAQDLQLCHVLISFFLNRLIKKMSETVCESDEQVTDHKKTDSCVDPFAQLPQPFTSQQTIVTSPQSIPQTKEQPTPEQSTTFPPKHATKMDVISEKPSSSSRLLDLTDPEKFTLDLPPTSKRKTTKQDFLTAQSAHRNVASSEESVGSCGTPAAK